MKNITKLLIVALVAILSSCAAVIFKDIAPKKGDILKEYPKEMQGRYVGIDVKDGTQSKDTIVITKTKIQADKFNVYGDIATKEDGEISFLKKFNDYYLLNMKAQDSGWVVIPLQFKDNVLTINTLSLSIKSKDKAKIIKKLRLFTDVTTIPDTSTYKIDSYLINPTDKELETIIDRGFFTKYAELKRVD